MVSFEGRTGPYVQYACVRIGSILSKAAAQGAGAGPIAVTAPAERALVLECARLPDVVASASRNLAPNEIADYVFALAQSFSRLLQRVPGAGSRNRRRTRLAARALRADKDGDGEGALAARHCGARAHVAHRWSRRRARTGHAWSMRREPMPSTGKSFPNSTGNPRSRRRVAWRLHRGSAKPWKIVDPRIIWRRRAICNRPGYDVP